MSAASDYDETDSYLVLKRLLPDGRCLRLHVIVGGARLSLADTEHDEGFRSVYDYQDMGRALLETAQWDGEGEPDGWYRHEGRRRPQGDPEREYFDP